MLKLHYFYSITFVMDLLYCFPCYEKNPQQVEVMEFQHKAVESRQLND